MVDILDAWSRNQLQTLQGNTNANHDPLLFSKEGVPLITTTSSSACDMILSLIHAGLEKMGPLGNTNMVLQCKPEKLRHLLPVTRDS